MKLTPKDLEIEDERTVQRDYLARLRQQDRSIQGHEGPRNNAWTGTNKPSRRSHRVGELVGRVALAHPDPELGNISEYYIGECHAHFDGIEVFSWAAEVAATFFDAKGPHSWHGEVAGIRTFRSKDSQIEDFVDESVEDDAFQGFSKHQKKLLVPTAPSHRARPRSGTTPNPKPSASSSPRDDDVARPNQLRAESFLRRELDAPRKKSLGSVLQTLQHDQYELISRPAMDSMVIQGAPGTGKTIVAAHRAAYMLNAEAHNTLDGDVLLIGPTTHYASHVRGAVKQLAGDQINRVIVTSLPDLMCSITKVMKPKGNPSNEGKDVDLHLAAFVDSVIFSSKPRTSRVPTKQKRPGSPNSPAAIYERLRTGRVKLGSAVPTPEWRNYLARLPQWYTARQRKSLQPLMAYIGWLADPPVQVRNIEHIIVDEAQDLTALEWALLRRINRAGAWTIIGDLNQRRSQYTCRTWEEVLNIIEPRFDVPIENLQSGYRSTRPIVEFAGLLLPREQQNVTALQVDGPDPIVHRAQEVTELGGAAVTQAERLMAKYPRGTVAIITTGAIGRLIEDYLRANSWFKDPYAVPPSWGKAGGRLAVLHHDSARGLEFDGVVVVEPAAFPNDSGRHGPLYTALTRPNKELVVVNYRALPQKLLK
ncbi:AAA family ATPase [Gordonia sp. WA4-43]|uniref:AAA family ATPase n=1 Tax=Gordonia sp. WA4-43 TaxID=2878678 RepID=UPI001CFC23E8|nr:AAA family ATPase [Gordonia sp. WA4-43]UCZ88157.1 AAA family ATPase [Gordonia sp. WA4-43]